MKRHITSIKRKDSDTADNLTPFLRNVGTQYQTTRRHTPPVAVKATNTTFRLPKTYYK